MPVVFDTVATQGGEGGHKEKWVNVGWGKGDLQTEEQRLPRRHEKAALIVRSLGCMGKGRTNLKDLKKTKTSRTQSEKKNS